MKKGFVLWVLSFLITISIAVYQRLTGPTYPIAEKIELNENLIDVVLERSHGGEDDHTIKIEIKNPAITGNVFYKKYKTNDSWQQLPMEYVEGSFITYLPHQPPAGKLQYYIELYESNTTIRIPEDDSVIIRFKGSVPSSILISHIIIMFLTMLFSTRAGLEVFNNGKSTKSLSILTVIFLIVGGFILGPFTQLYAFGELWTGFPFGYDLTDNKTLIALIGWLFAIYMYRKSKYIKYWGFAAAILLLAVFAIPHSLLGSELDYNKLDKENNKIEQYRINNEGNNENN